MIEVDRAIKNRSRLARVTRQPIGGGKDFKAQVEALRKAMPPRPATRSCRLPTTCCECLRPGALTQRARERSCDPGVLNKFNLRVRKHNYLTRH
jgi:hypothetical protein